MIPTEGFRCTVRRLLLTYPKCDIPASELERAVVSSFGYGTESQGPILTQYAISRERHSDGTFHLHAALQFSKDITLRGPRLNRLIGSKCNVTKGLGRKFDWINMVKYVAGCVDKKRGQDNEVLTGPPDLLETVLKREKMLHKMEKTPVAAEALKLVVEGKSVFEVLITLPSLSMQSRSLLALKAIVDAHVAELDRIPKFNFLGVRPIIDHPISESFKHWFEYNFKPGAVRKIRDPALYLCGPGGIGKTSLLDIIRTFARVYIMTNEKQNMDDYNDEGYDIIAFDEFNAQWPITFLNQLVDGSEMRVQRKCLISCVKRRNLPILFLSNVHPTSLYTNVDARIRAAFLSRLVVVDMTEDNILPAKYITQFIDIQSVPK